LSFVGQTGSTLQQKHNYIQTQVSCDD